MADPAWIDADGFVFDRGRTRAAFVRNGDVFVRTLSSGRLQQITRSGEAESGLQFSSDERAIQYRRGTDWFAHDPASGLDGPEARVLAAKDPNEKKPTDIEQMQLRLFDTLREERARREAARLNTREQQRLIELHKDDVELAPYPLERHSFIHADSWLDEFKRIDRLFESRLR